MVVRARKPNFAGTGRPKSRVGAGKPALGGTEMSETVVRAGKPYSAGKTGGRCRETGIWRHGSGLKVVCVELNLPAASMRLC